MKLKMDWLRFESRIREVLQQYYRNTIGGDTAMDLIDDIVGEETGRGWESTDALKEMEK